MMMIGPSDVGIAKSGWPSPLKSPLTGVPSELVFQGSETGIRYSTGGVNPWVPVNESSGTVAMTLLVVRFVKVREPDGCVGPNADTVPVRVYVPPLPVIATAVAEE